MRFDAFRDGHVALIGDEDPRLCPEALQGIDVTTRTRHRHVLLLSLESATGG
jgi:hypothetical protein